MEQAALMDLGWKLNEVIEKWALEHNLGAIVGEVDQTQGRPYSPLGFNTMIELSEKNPDWDEEYPEANEEFGVSPTRTSTFVLSFVQED